jgi:hypothetical protein
MEPDSEVIAIRSFRSAAVSAAIASRAGKGKRNKQTKNKFLVTRFLFICISRVALDGSLSRSADTQLLMHAPEITHVEVLFRQDRRIVVTSVLGWAPVRASIFPALAHDGSLAITN